MSKVETVTDILADVLKEVEEHFPEEEGLLNLINQKFCIRMSRTFSEWNILRFKLRSRHGTDSISR